MACIVEGRSSLDESLVTGRIDAADQIGGERDRRHPQPERRLHVMAAKVGRDTMLARIVDGRARPALARADPASRRQGPAGSCRR
jgi:cation transport ATPase